MVSKDAMDEPYPVTPKRDFTSESVREWVRGAEIRLEPVQKPPTDPDMQRFAAPGTILFDALQWMPTDRRKQVMRRWSEDDEQETDQ